jgi:hypothetical protein
MRAVMVTATPHLPRHERARVAPAALLSHLASSHAMRVVALDARGQTPAPRRRCLSGFEHVLAGQHVLVAEGDAETAAAATLLLREPVVAATLAATARHLVERRYTWAAVARCYESLWASVAAPRPVAVAA